jgi:hypothetical protein
MVIRGLTIGLVAAVALVVGALSWMGWTLALNAGHLLPSPSWLSALLPVLMAALVLSAGVPVRRFLRGQATRPLSPIRATRTLVLAQAAALTGAAVLGWYAGQLVCALSDLGMDHNRVVLWPLVATSVAGLALAVAGLLTQRMCRIPTPPEDHDR